MPRHPARLSRFLSFVLRHRPAAIGLTLDPQGWAALDELLAKSRAAGTPVTREALLEIVAADGKQRFTLSPDGQRIRAAQGHSVAVELGLTPRVPPELLYHGTATRFLKAILADGLRSQGRRHVHLSADVATAQAVGQRHGLPVVLVVAARRLHGQGAAFFRADNGVWLTERVPPRFLHRLPARPPTGPGGTE